MICVFDVFVIICGIRFIIGIFYDLYIIIILMNGRGGKC